MKMRVFQQPANPLRTLLVGCVLYSDERVRLQASPRRNTAFLCCGKRGSRRSTWRCGFNLWRSLVPHVRGGAIQLLRSRDSRVSRSLSVAGVFCCVGSNAVLSLLHFP